MLSCDSMNIKRIFWCFQDNSCYHMVELFCKLVHFKMQIEVLRGYHLGGSSELNATEG